MHIRLSDSEGKQGLLEILKMTIKKLLDAVSGETDLGVITVRQNSLRIFFFQESFLPNLCSLFGCFCEEKGLLLVLYFKCDGILT